MQVIILANDSPVISFPDHILQEKWSGYETLSLKVLFLREAFLSSAFVDTVSDQKLDSSEGLERDYFLC